MYYSSAPINNILDENYIVMKRYLLFLLTIILFLSCGGDEIRNTILVNDGNELNLAIKNALPGDEIVLANGVWTDVQIRFIGLGEENKPIRLRAESPGKVFIEGQSNLHLAGEYLYVSGLHFRNGYSPENGVIRFMVGEDSIANNCSVSHCAIEDFSKPNRSANDRWIEFFGRYNQLDHCYIAGKSNDGTTLMVYQFGNEHINNYHQITNNYFGPRPRKGGPRAETLRIGSSQTSMTPGYVNVANNYFEACNGEVEIISSKTNFNTFRKNIFYKCEGSLVVRHGNYATIDGNIFIGDDDSDFYGGIRVVNTGHWITNNYFYKINGEEFRSPLAIMNGIPKSPLNRYNQVTDVVVAFNTWIDCKSPWQVGVGENKKSAGVLPKSEIRSAIPIRTIIANNLIYNNQADDSPLVNHDNIKGISFKNNLLDNHGQEYTEYGVFINGAIKIKKINEWLYAPEEEQNAVLDDVFSGFEFNKIQQDLFGSSRIEKNRIGAINQLAGAENFTIDKKKFGPDWYSTESIVNTPTILTASSAKGELEEKIAQANDGDIIELSDKLYRVGTSLKIDKKISIRPKDTSKKSQIIFTGSVNPVAFEMNPKGKLILKNLILKSENNQIAFAPLKKNMSASYTLSITDCQIEDFGHIVLAYKGSFADSISITSSTLKNCQNGIELAAEPDKGDYSAEMVTIQDCEFIKIKNNVIHFYRGGYDESTIGGCLTLLENTFTDCGMQEKNGILIKTRGIVNVTISDNTFRDNPVRIIALLWGEKNNHHLNNTINNSGQIKVEEQQKLELLY